MDLSKNNQYDSRSETVEMGRKLHTAAVYQMKTYYNYEIHKSMTQKRNIMNHTKKLYILFMGYVFKHL